MFRTAPAQTHAHRQASAQSRRLVAGPPLPLPRRAPVNTPKAPGSLRTAERLCIGGIAAAAIAAFGIATVVGGIDANQIAPAALFAALVALAWLFPLPFSFKTDLCLDASVLLAALLLLGPAEAMLVAAAGAGLAQLVRRRDRAEAIFNTAQVSLQVAAAALALAAFGWERERLAALGATDAIPILAAAVALFACTDVLVAAMVAAQTGLNPFRAWLASLRQTSPADAAAQLAQVGIGAAAAVLAFASPWLLGLLLLPAGAVQLSLAAAHHERRRTAQVLRNTEAALAEAERIAHLGSWEWDLESGTLHWSDETCRILGHAPAAAMPSWTAFLAMVHPDDRRELDARVHRALASGGRFFFEHRLIRTDGEERTVHAQGEVIRDERGEKRRLVATIQDVTERKRAERAKDDLLASISHDLKSPLTVIQGQAQLLRRRLDRNPDPEALRSGLERIDETAQAMATQITELLEFARQEMASTIPPAPIELGPLVHERAALYQQATERHTIRIDAPESGPVVRGDRRQLARVLDNLIGNAVKYSPDGGEIAIRVTVARDGRQARAVVAVHDHGIGIPREDLLRIFNSYQRGSNVGRIEGSGIGLAGVKRLVALHGGEITADSDPVAGTTFTITLPLTP